MKNLKKKLIEANNWNTNYTRQLEKNQRIYKQKINKREKSEILIHNNFKKFRYLYKAKQKKKEKKRTNYKQNKK